MLKWNQISKSSLQLNVYIQMNIGFMLRFTFNTFYAHHGINRRRLNIRRWNSLGLRQCQMTWCSNFIHHFRIRNICIETIQKLTQRYRLLAMNKKCYSPNWFRCWCNWLFCQTRLIFQWTEKNTWTSTNGSDYRVKWLNFFCQAFNYHNKNSFTDVPHKIKFSLTLYFQKYLQLVINIIPKHSSVQLLSW